MSPNDDFIGRLEDYLETFDGATPLPDRVRDAIRAELPSARQVRPRPGPVREFTMLLANASAGARVGLAAAAVVVAVVLGAAYLNNNGSGVVGGAPTPTPTATSAPTISPSLAPTPEATPAVQPPQLAAGQYIACDATDTEKSCLAAGTYQLSGSPDVWPVRVTVAVPAGWNEWDAGPGADAVLVDGGPADRATGWGVMFATVGDVARDPCDSTKGVIPAAQIDTPQQLAAAMAAWPKFTATTPKQIVVDGHDGLQFQLTSTAQSLCYEHAWLTKSGTPVDAYPMVSSAAVGTPGTFEIVNTGHGLLVIRTTDFPQTSPNELGAGVAPDPTRHAADQVALHAILDSIRINPPGSS